MPWSSAAPTKCALGARATVEQILGRGDLEKLLFLADSCGSERHGDAAMLDKGHEQCDRDGTEIAFKREHPPRGHARSCQRLARTLGTSAQVAVGHRPLRPNQGFTVSPLVEPVEQPAAAHDTPPR